MVSWQAATVAAACQPSSLSEPLVQLLAEVLQEEAQRAIGVFVEGTPAELAVVQGDPVRHAALAVDDRDLTGHREEVAVQRPGVAGSLVVDGRREAGLLPNCLARRKDVFDGGRGKSFNHCVGHQSSGMSRDRVSRVWSFQNRHIIQLFQSLSTGSLLWHHHAACRSAEEESFGRLR